MRTVSAFSKDTWTDKCACCGRRRTDVWGTKRRKTPMKGAEIDKLVYDNTALSLATIRVMRKYAQGVPLTRIAKDEGYTRVWTNQVRYKYDFVALYADLARAANHLGMFPPGTRVEYVDSRAPFPWDLPVWRKQITSLFLRYVVALLVQRKLEQHRKAWLKISSILRGPVWPGAEVTEGETE
jgi:hypothetical protein